MFYFYAIESAKTGIDNARRFLPKNLMNVKIWTISQQKNRSEGNRHQGDQNNRKKAVLLFMEGQRPLPLGTQLSKHELTYCTQAECANHLSK